MECPVCFEAWDLQQVRPKVFSACAHSVCAACLEDLKERQCPTCREAFSDPVLDNFALIAILESASEDTEPPVWWCLSCKRPSSSQCVVAEHDVKRPKAALRRGLAGLATRCSQQLEGVEADCFQDMQDSNALAALELLDAERAAFKLAMTLDDGKVVSCEWRDGDAGVSALAKMCLVAAAAKGRAQASGEAAAQQRAVERIPPAPCQLAAQCDVGDQEPNFASLSYEARWSELEEKYRALVYCRQRGVRRIRLFCRIDHRWVLAVLQQAGPTLEELALASPTKEHLAVVSTMPRLQRLELRSVPIPIVDPWEAPPHPGSVKWLQVRGLSEADTWFLLESCAASLEVVWLELYFLRGPQGELMPEWYSPFKLDGKLRQCGFSRLQRLVLWRSNRVKSCDALACQIQLDEARRALPGCTVQCEYCDRVPKEDF